MLPIMAREENVAPDTASTFMLAASSTVLPFHWLKSEAAWLKKSGVSSLGRASMWVTTPLAMVIFSGTLPA